MCGIGGVCVLTSSNNTRINLCTYLTKSSRNTRPLVVSRRCVHLCAHNACVQTNTGQYSMHMLNSTRQILHVCASLTPPPSFHFPCLLGPACLPVSLSLMAFPPRANHQEEEHVLSVQKTNVKLRTSALSTVQELRQGQLLLKEDLLAKTKAVGACPHP